MSARLNVWPLGVPSAGLVCVPSLSELSSPCLRVSVVESPPEGAPMKSAQLKALRRGFTLVELLAVIVIIGILASLSLYAASVAWVAAKNGRIAMDIKTLETDLQAYYSKF